MRALVTGAGGFIGANLLRALLEAGHDVTAWLRPGGVEWRLDGLAGDIDVAFIDLLDGATYTWSGPTAWVELDPDVRAAHVLWLRRP